MHDNLKMEESSDEGGDVDISNNIKDVEMFLCERGRGHPPKIGNSTTVGMLYTYG